TDQPWEGNACGLFSVFQDEGIFRMYYRGLQMTVTDTNVEVGREFYCYAESEDGIHWERRELGQVEFNGSTKNNILKIPDFPGLLVSFSPFKDHNPAAESDARYKAWAVGGHARPKAKHGLYALKSSDGFHWELMSDQPVITCGEFDSHNVAFWDEEREEYRSYHRNCLERESYMPHEDGTAGGTRASRGGRDILTATSQDFLNWSDSALLHYREGKPDELYTNGIIPYFRAPHIFLGFPMRYIDRGWSDAMNDLPELEHRRRRANVSERYGSALTDTMFMSSRDGLNFKLSHESFIRPGLRPQDNWTYADNFQNWGIVTTESPFPGAPDKLSIYTIEGYWRGESLNLRRHTLRMDGFLSIRAPLSGGELITKPIIFSGSELLLNFSASAAGSIRVEVLRDEEDVSIVGFTVDDCREVLGDDLERRVVFNGSPDISRLAGLPIRLRFLLKDADLFAFRFR
ncbi:MAG: hypothetical protein QF886_18575, partial [Planctomycetota bacterium]|nr:hypothetical protein [Planctomycetota bacterium]